MKTPPAACTECRNLIGGYVLDALDPVEMEAVRLHLAECSGCAAEHDRLAGIPALLDLTGATENSYEHPPVGLEEAVLDNFARDNPVHEPRASRRPLRAHLGGLVRPLRRPLPAAAVGALAAAGIAIAIVSPGGGGGSSASSVAWGPGEMYHAQLGGSSVAPTAHAFARLQSNDAGTRVSLHVSGLKGSPNTLYELWCVRDDGTKISAGTFRVDSQGRANVDLTSAAIIGDYHRLSVERRAQPPARSAGQRVMTGEIQFGTS